MIRKGNGSFNSWGYGLSFKNMNVTGITVMCVYFVLHRFDILGIVIVFIQ